MAQCCHNGSGFSNGVADMMTVRCVILRGREYERIEKIPLDTTFLQFVMSHSDYDYVEIIDVQY